MVWSVPTISPLPSPTCVMVPSYCLQWIAIISPPHLCIIFQFPSKETEWFKHFENLFQFQNCLRTVDGKHFSITLPHGSKHSGRPLRNMTAESRTWTSGSCKDIGQSQEDCSRESLLEKSVVEALFTLKASRNISIAVLHHQRDQNSSSATVKVSKVWFWWLMPTMNTLLIWKQKAVSLMVL